MLCLLIWKIFGLKSFYQSIPQEEIRALKIPKAGSWLDAEEFRYEFKIPYEIGKPLNAFVLEVVQDQARVCLIHQDRISSSLQREFYRPLNDLKVSFGTLTWRVLKRKFFSK